MAKYENLLGLKFGKLTPIEYLGVIKGNSHWLCTCDCGSEKPVRSSSLKNGHTLSCGCLQVVSVTASNTTHGHCSKGKRSPEYAAWSNMVKRCTVITYRRYKDYGGRGVRVCDRWLTSFEAFLEDMGSRPAKGYSIERKDNSGNYSPENCEWATRRVQDRNKRDNRVLFFRGKSDTVTGWCEVLDLNRHDVYARLNRHGWSIERALSTPTVKGCSTYVDNVKS